MSNIGANIWTTGEAIKNPELVTSALVIGSASLTSEFSVNAGDVTGAQAALTFSFSVEASTPNQASADLSFGLLMFSGDITGADANFSLGQISISSAEEAAPNIQGATLVFDTGVISSGYSWTYGTADIELPLSIFSGDITGGGADFSIGSIQVETLGLPTTFINGLVRISGLAINLPATSDALDFLVAEDVSTLDTMVVIHERINIAAYASSSFLRAHVTGNEDIAIKAALSLPYVLQFAENLEIVGEQDITAFKLVSAFASAGLFDETDSAATLVVTIAQALVVLDRADNAVSLTLQEALEIVADASSGLEAAIQAVDALTASVVSSAQGLFTVAVDEALLTDDGAFSTAFLQALAEDGAEIYTSIRVGDEVIQGWVVSTKTAGFSEYQNFPFNSLVEADGSYFAVAEDGLYELTGDTDAGASISAAFKTGLLDLGSHYLKDAKAAHLGYTSDGKLVLKVTTTAKGQKEEWWYELKHGAADSMREGRFTIGRGLRAKYWQFEITNVDGADFEVDDVQIMYSILSRRIR